MIRQWVDDLLSFTDDDWARYSFNRDPLVGRLSHACQVDHRQKTIDSALALTMRLRKDYKYNDIHHLATQLGIRVLKKEFLSSSGYSVFAFFEEPDTITVYSDNAEATDRILLQHALYEMVGYVRTADLLLAHEVYHYLEKHVPDIYSAQKHLTLWNIGLIKNQSRIICLEEIGAMAFAKEVTGLKCSPYLFNVIMMYPQNPQRAKNIYENYMRVKPISKELSC